MADRLTSMQVFAQVVASGSFSAAGRALGLSQTMVTKHVAELEERLGLALLHRTTRRLSLTDPGRRFLDGSHQILTQLAEFEESFLAERNVPRGRLRISLPVAFSLRYVTPRLPAFHALYPELEVELGLDDRKVNLVEEGWDMALRIRRPESGTLRARRLARVSMVLCAAPAYLERHGVPSTAAELEEHRCLGYTLGDRNPWRWHFGETGDIVRNVAGPLCANNGEALTAAAVGGMGIAYQPLFLVADEIRAGRLREIALDTPLDGRLGLYALYPAGRAVSPKVRAMIDFLSVEFGSVPPWEGAVSVSLPHGDLTVLPS